MVGGPLVKKAASLSFMGRSDPSLHPDTSTSPLAYLWTALLPLLPPQNMHAVRVKHIRVFEKGFIRSTPTLKTWHT